MIDELKLVPPKPHIKGETFLETTTGESMKNMDWEKYRQLAFMVLDGERKTGMTWEEYNAKT